VVTENGYLKFLAQMYTQFIVVIDTLSVQSITTILSQIKEQKQKNIPTETFAGLKYPPTKTRL